MFVVMFALRPVAGNRTLGDLGGFLLERQYGLSIKTLGGWLTDQGKALRLVFTSHVIGVSVVYVAAPLARKRPRDPAIHIAGDKLSAHQRVPVSIHRHECGSTVIRARGSIHGPSAFNASS
jgi:hypothetical protein